ncbi:MAG: ribonuclease H-like domain-containing protein [Acidobacteriota bacterium]
MDLSSRLRAIVKGGPPKPVRELTYEPDAGGYEAVMDIARVGAMLGGRPATTPFGQCLVIDRRYEADRFHGSIRVGACDVEDCSALGVLDPALGEVAGRRQAGHASSRTFARTVFIDLETTGLSGGAGTVAFLVGCGYFDLGAFQVTQFLLTSFASERALLAAVASFFEGVDLIVTYNGKTFDVPVMETRWMFHRLQMPLAEVPHFDMLHPARRLWRMRTGAGGAIEDSGCRLSTLEHTLFSVTRVGDVDGFEIPGRFFQFLRSGDPRPLEPVLEHNRLDLVSLAAVMARGVQLAREGHSACRDEAEALALGRIYERAGSDERLDDRVRAVERADACYRRAAGSPAPEVRGEALYRIGLCHRRERRFADAAAIWRSVIELTEPRGVRRQAGLRELRQFAVEALAIHHEHRERDLEGARELALFALEEANGRRADGMRHRIARIDRKMSVTKARRLAHERDAQLFTS